MIDYLEEEQASYTLVNTKPFVNGFKRLLNPIVIFIKVLAKINASDVVFLNSSRGGTKYLVPILYFMSKIFRAKFVFRPFGGDIKDYTANYNSFQKYLFNKTALKADIFFLQTKELIAYYANTNANTIQLPTSRISPAKEFIKLDRVYKKRFVYLGMVHHTKGIDFLIDAKKELGQDYVIHVYGPIKEEKYNTIFQTEKDIYKGVVDKSEVNSMLSNYDVLVLPTFYQGEGYPGVILEAYSLGLPVITTQWKAIPEIVKDKETGILIPPKSLDALTTALRMFNKSNYAEYSQKARLFFEKSFNSKMVTAKAVDQIKALF